MKYSSIKKAIFIKRPNRFIAHVLLDGKEEIVHVKNTGRCKEIYKEGTTVFLEESHNKNRKTRYSMIGAYKNNKCINTDAQIPNFVVFEGIEKEVFPEFKNIKVLKREVTFGNSRFDIYFENESSKGFIEVKGVTLEENGITMFPDAPTQRGTKHVLELIKAVKEGYDCYIFFLVQMKDVSYFTPYKERDPAFAASLSLAKDNGVKILCYDSYVSEDEINIGDKVNVII